MALLIYRVVTSGSIAIVYQILSMNASVFCSRISPRGATGDLCKDTAKCRHLHIAHILAYMCLRLRRRTFAAIAHTQKNRERARKANGK